jgi:hypothetical protein
MTSLLELEKWRSCSSHVAIHFCAAGRKPNTPLQLKDAGTLYATLRGRNPARLAGRDPERID